MTHNANLFPGIAVLLVVLFSGRAVFAGDVVELKLPLKAGRYYSLLELRRECHLKLGAPKPQPTDDRQLMLLPAEKVALLAYAKACPEFLEVEFTEEGLLLRLPDRQDARVRRRNRRRLERLLGITIEEWPPDKGLHLPPGFRPGAPTILLVHGMEATAQSMTHLGQAFQDRSLQVAFFDYPNDGPVAWAGDRLNAELLALEKKHPSLRIVIVAHSMGGLAARHALECCPQPPSCVSDLFMLGTPHHGSRLAVRQDYLELVLASPWSRGSSQWTNLLDGLGEAGDDLRPGSRFLTQLNAKQRNNSVRYHSAIGRRGIWSERDATEAIQNVEKVLTRRGISAEKRQSIVTFLREAEELRTGSGDGAVSMKSAHLFGTASEQVFDLTHWEFLQSLTKTPGSRAVVDWIIQTHQEGKHVDGKP